MPGVAFLVVAALALPMLAPLLPRIAGALADRGLPGASRIPWQTALPAMWLASAVFAAVSSRWPAEFALGAWAPVSVTGAPLLFATGAGSSVFLAAVLASLGLAQAGRFRASFTDGAVAVAIGLLALANNLPALLIGLGLLDLATSVTSLQRDRAPTRAYQVFMNGASIVCMLVATAVQLSVANSPYLPLGQISPQAAVWWTSAVVVRAAWLSFARIGGNAEWGALGTLVIAAKLFAIGGPAIGGQWLLLVLGIGLVRLVLAWLRTDDPDRAREHLVFGSAALALGATAIGSTDTILLAGGTWCAGVALLTFVPRVIESEPVTPGARLVAFVARVLGALALAGLPLTASFSAHAGAMTAMAARTPSPGLAAIGTFAAQALLSAVMLRLVFTPSGAGLNSGLRPPANGRSVVVAGALLLGALLVSLGIMPGLAGARSLGTAIEAPGLLEWVTLAGGSALGIALWWFESRIVGGLEHARLPRDSRTIRERLIAALDLSWLPALFASAADRLARPLGAVFPFLESDGALIWAIVAVVIALLVSRPGTP